MSSIKIVPKKSKTQAKETGSKKKINDFNVQIFSK